MGFINSCFSFCEVRYFLVVVMLIGVVIVEVLLVGLMLVAVLFACGVCVVLGFVGWGVTFCLVSWLV